MRTYFELELAMERGIELLDSENPNWAKKINVNTLDIKSADNCMLGQIYSHYFSGLLALDISATEAIDYGFNGNSTGAEYEDYFRESATLQAIWAEEIQTRQTF